MAGWSHLGHIADDDGGRVSLLCPVLVPSDLAVAASVGVEFHLFSRCRSPIEVAGVCCRRVGVVSGGVAVMVGGAKYGIPGCPNPTGIVSRTKKGCCDRSPQCPPRPGRKLDPRRWSMWLGFLAAAGFDSAHS